jgi:hypothetical protein
MFCFCYNELVNDPFKFSAIDFTEFGDPAAEKTCDRFLGYFRIIQLYQSIPAAMIQFINIVSTFIFIFMAKLEGRYTKTIMNNSIFNMIFLQEFMCVGVVQIYTEPYKNFDVLWYMVAGTGLCYAMCISIFSTKASELVSMMIKLLQRCYDRRGSLKIRKQNEFDEDDDQPNTK